MQFIDKKSRNAFNSKSRRFNTQFISYISVFVLALFFSSCSYEENVIKNNETNFEDKYKITFYSKDTIDGYEIKLFTKSELKTGYNKIYYTVSKNDIQNIKRANFQLEMKMMMHSHSCPIDSSYKEEAGLMSNGFVIVMPGNEEEKWYLTLDIILENTTQLKLEKTLEITKNGQIKMFMFDGKTYFISEADYSKYSVGKNNLNLKVNFKESNYSWGNSYDFDIEIKPWMASMGHGSPNNEHPISIGNGFYKGVINFTMTGDWEINFIIKKGSEVINEGKFDYIIE